MGVDFCADAGDLSGIVIAHVIDVGTCCDVGYMLGDPLCPSGTSPPRSGGEKGNGDESGEWGPWSLGAHEIVDEGLGVFDFPAGGVDDDVEQAAFELEGGLVAVVDRGLAVAADFERFVDVVAVFEVD